MKTKLHVTLGLEGCGLGVIAYPTNIQFTWAEQWRF